MKDSPRRMIYSREIRDMLESMGVDPCLDPKCELKLCRIRQTTYCPPIAIRWRPDYAALWLRELSQDAVRAFVNAGGEIYWVGTLCSL